MLSALSAQFARALHHPIVLCILRTLHAADRCAFSRRSLLIPPLLALAYALLGGVFPPLAMAFVGGSPPSPRGAPGPTAALAVSSTVAIIKLSELLQQAGLPPAVALLLLALPCALQWRLLDGSRASLALALLAAVGFSERLNAPSQQRQSGPPTARCALAPAHGWPAWAPPCSPGASGAAKDVDFTASNHPGGPLAELPLMKLGAWHYLTPDFWPLAAWSLGAGTGNEWAGLSAITGPCYFAVTTDAIALGRWFGSEPDPESV
jgi:hypothetical protein